MAYTRLERWWWSTVGGGGVYLRGEVYDDQPPRSFADGEHVTTSHVEEAQRLEAAEGNIVSTESGRRYILGCAATLESLARQRDEARREARDLQEQVSTLRRGEGVKKRPRGRAPDGCSWDPLSGGWLDENNDPFVKVENKKRKAEVAERAAARQVHLHSNTTPACTAAQPPICTATQHVLFLTVYRRSLPSSARTSMAGTTTRAR